MTLYGLTPTDVIPLYCLTPTDVIPHYGLTPTDVIPLYGLTPTDVIPHYGLTPTDVIPHYGLTPTDVIPHCVVPSDTLGQAACGIVTTTRSAAGRAWLWVTSQSTAIAPSVPEIRQSPESDSAYDSDVKPP
ncbi:hypothetical protein ACOMHN_061918 [Nucella lapillus]